MIRVIFLLCLCLAVMPGTATAEEGDHKTHQTAGKISPLPNAEAILSPHQFHSGSLAWGFAREKASMGAHYFGSETYEVGAFGPSLELGRLKRLHLPKWLAVSMGITAAIVRDKEFLAHDPHAPHNLHPSNPFRSVEPAFLIRWRVEKGWLVSEGNYLQMLRPTDHRRNSYSDGSHVGVRFARHNELSITWATANHREERERKLGGRYVRKLNSRISGGVIALAPGRWDVRGILLFHGSSHQE